VLRAQPAETGDTAIRAFTYFQHVALLVMVFEPFEHVALCQPCGTTACACDSAFPWKALWVLRREKKNELFYAL
jgi:hypothetical protein